MPVDELSHHRQVLPFDRVENYVIIVAEMPAGCRYVSRPGDHPCHPVRGQGRLDPGVLLESCASVAGDNRNSRA